MCMVQRWRGLAPTEDAFHRGAPRKGWDLAHAARLLGRVRPARDDARDIDLALHLGHVVLVLVLCPRYVAWFNTAYPGMQSRYGALCPPGDWGGPPHCVLLVARRAEGYDFHDPWYPAAGQPFHIPEDELERCFSGYAAIAEP